MRGLGQRVALWAAGVRMLPLAIAGMLLLGGFKAGVLVLGVVGPTLVEAGVTAGRAVIPVAHASGGPSAASKPATAPAAPMAEPPPVPATPQVQADPGPSEAERALLQDLRARRVALEARDQSVQAREALLGAAERRLSERVEQLTALQTRLEALEQTRRERDETNWRGLVKTYETMRPRDAAAIFNDLEQTVLMQVLDRMKEAKAAPILAAMQPERARAATAQLAQWRVREPGTKG